MPEYDIPTWHFLCHTRHGWWWPTPRQQADYEYPMTSNANSIASTTRFNELLTSRRNTLNTASNIQATYKPPTSTYVAKIRNCNHKVKWQGNQDSGSGQKFWIQDWSFFSKFQSQMITPSWSTFVTNHLNRDNLMTLPGKLPTTLSTLVNQHPPTHRPSNRQNWQSSLPLTHSIITSPPFLSPTNRPILPGQSTQHLLALQGFTPTATTIELNKTDLFPQTTTTITAPTLTQFLSYHDKSLEQLKTINTTPDYHPTPSLNLFQMK